MTEQSQTEQTYSERLVSIWLEICGLFDAAAQEFGGSHPVTRAAGRLALAMDEERQRLEAELAGTRS